MLCCTYEMSLFKNKTKSDIDRMVRTLSGEEEGAFAWISLNYLNGYFDEGSNVPDYGVLETGGASTQVHFHSS